ncbi:hypothetical protein FisN_22Hh007 [Fistulifera solaris]|uniref:Transmembrane protein n=1 Tax=Fistulifera solaris TaxID=1519565 RepID=A0A1Z5K2Z8_FISSO|nr:hypothetical protein FisN_22Hh007 [Fistulifera solaris]|eukprot:GAX20441.1 hypothetical protein FisN_22Hh007 [Fistulifera solaris]
MTFLQPNAHYEERKMHNSQHTNWFLAAAFATIALVSLFQDLERFNGRDDFKDQGQKITWVGSAIICALGLASIGLFMGLFLRHRFVGNLLEVMLAFLTVGIWAAVLPTIMNPKHNIATAGDFGQIINANLFVFPWLGLISAVAVLGGSMRLFFDRDVAKDEKSSSTFVSWGAFVATSLIVMMAASRQYEDMMCDDEDTTMCDRLQYATWVGAIGGFLAFLWMMWDLCLPNRFSMVETVLSILVLTAWCFGITYITFSDNAPAPTFSTLYFFSWGSFALAAGLVASAVYRMFGAVMPGDDYSEDDHVQAKEVEHSDEDDNDDEERGRGAVVVEDEGIAAVPPTTAAKAHDQVYK